MVHFERLFLIRFNDQGKFICLNIFPMRMKQEKLTMKPYWNFTVINFVNREKMKIFVKILFQADQNRK